MPRNACNSLSHDEQRERLDRIKRDIAQRKRELQAEAKRAASAEKRRILAELRRLRTCATCPAMREFLARDGR